MKERFIAALKTRRYNSYVLYLVAGGYLMYLAYKMLRDMDASAGNVLLICVLAVFFGLCGLLLVSVSLLAMYKGWFAERAAAERERDAEDEDARS